jgi:hypothetical protein
MTVHELMRWLEQFQGWIGLGLVAFPCVTYGLGALLKLCTRRRGRSVAVRGGTLVPQAENLDS